MKNVKAKIAVAAITLLPAFAQAALIDMGDFTRDTATNLDWLDLSKSLNKSFNDVVGQMGVGGQFEGWRHATREEVGTLFHSSAGIPTGSASSNPAVVDSVRNLQSMLGFTTRAGTQLTQMVNGTSIVVDGVTLYRSSDLTYSSSSNAAFARQQGPLSWNDYARQTNLGHALVRVSEVPEPKTWELMVAGGLVFLGIIAKRGTAEKVTRRMNDQDNGPKIS